MYITVVHLQFELFDWGRIPKLLVTKLHLCFLIFRAAFGGYGILKKFPMYLANMHEPCIKMHIHQTPNPCEDLASQLDLGEHQCVMWPFSKLWKHCVWIWSHSIVLFPKVKEQFWDKPFDTVFQWLLSRYRLRLLALGWSASCQVCEWTQMCGLTLTWLL